MLYRIYTQDCCTTFPWHLSPLLVGHAARKSSLLLMRTSQLVAATRSAGRVGACSVHTRKPAWRIGSVVVVHRWRRLVLPVLRERGIAWSGVWRSGSIALVAKLVQIFVLIRLAAPGNVYQPLLHEFNTTTVDVAVEEPINKRRRSFAKGLDRLLIVGLRRLKLAQVVKARADIVHDRPTRRVVAACSRLLDDRQHLQN